MARSRYALPIVALFVALPIACAQVTGLSDDYKFDLGGSSGGGGDASGEGGDGSTILDGGKCSAGDQSTASADIKNANGENLPSSCKSCLIASCCAQIHACAALSACRSSMSCIFNCQDKTQPNEKSSCLRNCDENAFNATVGVCASQDCQQACDLKSR